MFEFRGKALSYLSDVFCFSCIDICHFSVDRVTKDKFNVMHFNAALNLDVTKFKNCKMEREGVQKDVKEDLEGEQPEFGAGSEFGRKEREEARRRKYERRKSKQNNSPWVLKVGSGKQSRKYVCNDSR